MKTAFSFAIIRDLCLLKQEKRNKKKRNKKRGAEEKRNKQKNWIHIEELLLMYLLKRNKKDK